MLGGVIYCGCHMLTPIFRRRFRRPATRLHGLQALHPGRHSTCGKRAAARSSSIIKDVMHSYLGQPQRDQNRWRAPGKRDEQLPKVRPQNSMQISLGIRLTAGSQTIHKHVWSTNLDHSITNLSITLVPPVFLGISSGTENHLDAARRVLAPLTSCECTVSNSNEGGVQHEGRAPHLRIVLQKKHGPPLYLRNSMLKASRMVTSMQQRKQTAPVNRDSASARNKTARAMYNTEAQSSRCECWERQLQEA